MILGLKVQLRGLEAKDHALEADQGPGLVPDLEALLFKDQDRLVLNKTPKLKMWPRITILRKTTSLRNPDQNLDRNPDQSLNQNPDRDQGRSPDRDLDQSRQGPTDPSLDPQPGPTDPSPDPRPDPRLDPRPDPRPGPTDPSLDHQYHDRVQGLPHVTAQDLDRGQDQRRPL